MDITPLSESQVTPPTTQSSKIFSSGTAGTGLAPSAAGVSTNLFYTVGGEKGTVASEMGKNVDSSRTDVVVTAPGAPLIDSWGWVAQDARGLTKWPATTYSVALNITRPNSTLKIVAVKIYRVNADGGGALYRGLSLVGAQTGLSVSLGTAGVKTFAVNGVPQDASASDKLAVKFYTASTSGHAQNFAYDGGKGALSQVIIAPVTGSTPTPGPSSNPTSAPTSTPSARPTAAPKPTPTPVVTPVPTAAPQSQISHVTVVMMENVPYEQIIGNGQAPYINGLASSGALLTNSHGVTHPSQPNYLALFSGSTQGVTDDACPYTFNSANVASEMIAKGYTFAGLSENLPSDKAACTGGSLYGRRHNPWADFSNVPASDSLAYTGPLYTLPADLTFVVPNTCDDMHDCSISSADGWLSRNIPAILSYDRSHNGLLILTWDEGDNSSTNHIVTILAGPMVHAGQYSQYINHYDILRAIEQNFGLPLTGAAATANALPAGLIP
ncbi:MAG TPA: alkaline phosphatase family protein [Candidatus Baltobacteraceae bacterium]|jgi:acid phosphatase